MDHVPGFYGSLARLAIRRRHWVVGIVALVTLVAGLLAARLKVDSDILSLMPADDPAAQRLRALDKAEGGTSVLTLTVEGTTPAARDALMVELEKGLLTLPQVEDVVWRLEPALAWRVGLVQMPLADLEALRDRLRAALQLGPAAANPFVAARLFDLGPLADKLAAGDSASGLAFATRQGQARMIVRPRGSVHDLPFSRTLMTDVRRVLDTAGDAHPDARVAWVGGGYRHSVEDYEGVVADMRWITLSSFVMVVLILVAAFRTPRALAVLMVPLLVANIWTLGVAAVTVGSLNTFTSFANAVLIGVGVEFGVHLYARYREQRAAGLAVEDAVVRTWDLIGGTCTSAALTSSAGFAALVAAHFAGFRQLGWILALGLLICLAVVLVLTPVLLMALERATQRAPSAPRKARLRRRRPSTYRVAPVFLVGFACLTVVSAILVRHVQFEYDISALRREGLGWSELSEGERQAARDSYSPAIATFPDLATLDATLPRLEARIADGSFPEVQRVLSLRTLLPADQVARLAILREIREMAADPAVAWLPAKVQSTLAHVRATDLAPLTPADLPRGLRRVLGADAPQPRALLMPADNMWDMRESARLADAIARELPGVDVTGEFTMLAAVHRMLQRDTPIVGAIAVGLVVLFTALDLRRVRATLGALGVLAAGMCWWGALVVLSGQRLSLVNIVGIPIVLGIGVDVMIHLVHRLNQEGPGSILKALATTGWASALGTSTTVVAFAALSFASARGVRSLGLVVLLGETAVTVAAFVLVPLGFATAWRMQGRTPHALAARGAERGQDGPPPAA
ncbi:MAG: hypothetical protein RLZZ299_3009 [Pseudomonadota bacterium]